MFRQIGPLEIILILVVLLLLFGAKRLPDLTRSVGRSMRIFKSEIRDLRDEDDKGAHGTGTGSTERTDRPAESAPKPLEGRVQPAAERPAERVPDSERREP